jgi:hypothetical protein
MAITYHAGRRIQGLERVGSTPSTEEVNFGSGYNYSASYFSATGSNGYTFTENASNIDQVMWKDLTTSVVGTKYVMRFSFTLTSFTGHTTNANNHKQEIGLGASYGTGEDPTHDFVGLRYNPNQNTSKIDFHILARDGSTKNYSAAYSVAYSSVSTPTTWYIEIIRNENVYTLNVYSDSAYSTSLGTATVTQTGITGLRYFNHNLFTQSSNGVSNGSSTGYDIYDGITSVVATAGDVKPTNVQEGSRFEEIDTRKMYNYGKHPTFQDDFSSDNWTDVGTQIGVSGGKMAWNALRSGSNQGSYYDIGTANISETEWVLDFTLDIDAMTEGDTNAYFTIGLSDTSTMNVNTSQDFIGLLTFLDTTSGGNSRFMATGANGGTTIGGTDFTTSDPQTLGLFYVRIRRTSATECKVAIYSNSDYSTLVEEQTVTITSGLTGLRYLKLTNLTVSGAGTGVFNGTMDNVKYYNGVTSVSNTWKEIGT